MTDLGKKVEGKVGILTFSYAHNYGAVLQCASLCKTIENLGYDTEVIKYRPSIPQGNISSQSAIKKAYLKLAGLSFSKLQRKYGELRYKKSVEAKFDRFKKDSWTFSKSCSSYEELSEVLQKYDSVVVGSDQVWNRADRAVTLAYFLEESLAYRGKRISYAACCGQIDTPRHEIEKVAQSLSHFDSLLVRDAVTKEWVKKVCGHNATIVLDPTLITDLEYDYFGFKVPCPKYILTYILGEEIEGGHSSVLQELKRIHGNIPVVAVATVASEFGAYPYADKVVWDAGPSEWVLLFQNATAVYTDSFHGIMFSIKNKKPFFSYYAEHKRAHRLLDLSDRFGLKGVIAENLRDAKSRNCFSCKIDYQELTKTLKQKQIRSVELLERALSGCQE